MNIIKDKRMFSFLVYDYLRDGGYMYNTITKEFPGGIELRRKDIKVTGYQMYDLNTSPAIVPSIDRDSYIIADIINLSSQASRYIINAYTRKKGVRKDLINIDGEFNTFFPYFIIPEYARIIHDGDWSKHVEDAEFYY